MENNLDIKGLLGKRIKDLRTERKLTQDKLSEMVGFGQRTLSKLERGKTFITAEHLAKLLTALDIGIEDLFNFGYLQEKEILKEELITAIRKEEVNIEILYRIYKSFLKKLLPILLLFNKIVTFLYVFRKH